MPFTATIRDVSDRAGLSVEIGGRERRRHDAVEQQAGADRVVPGARVAQERGGIGGVAPGAAEAHRAQRGRRAVETRALLVENGDSGSSAVAKCV